MLRRRLGLALGLALYASLSLMNWEAALTSYLKLRASAAKLRFLLKGSKNHRQSSQRSAVTAGGLFRRAVAGASPRTCPGSANGQLARRDHGLREFGAVAVRPASPRCCRRCSPNGLRLPMVALFPIRRGAAILPESEVKPVDPKRSFKSSSDGRFYWW
jgi:hypothetical protein